MDIEQRTAEIAHQLRHTTDLERHGLTPSSIANAVSAGRFIHLRRGWYAPAEFWAQAETPERHLAAVIVASREAERPRVFSHRSAATLLGLPVWSRWVAGETAVQKRLRQERLPATTLAVHAIVPEHGQGVSTPTLVRHRSTLAVEERTVLAGLRHTSPERTLFDLARTEPFVVAFACAERALSRVAWVDRRLELDAWEAWRERLLERTRRYPGVRGARAVRMIAQLADPRSESVLESVSRLRLLQLGFEFEQQMPVPSERGSMLYIDFVFRSLGVFGECDGKYKYTSAELRRGATPAEVVYAEKRRHDWVEGSTGMRGLRWGATDAHTALRLGRRLHAFGMPVPGEPTRAFGPEVAAFLRRLP